MIADFADQPYQDRKTNATVMDIAMKRFNGTGQRVPPAWLKVATDLRAGGTSQVAARRAEDAAQLRGLVQWQKENAAQRSAEPAESESTT